MIASSHLGESAAEIAQEAARLAIQTGDDSFVG